MEMGPLTVDELNQGYLTAERTYQYDLAIEFYLQGATQVYEQGHDILLVMIHAGRLDLVKEVMTKDYPIELYHLNAARSLVNVDQSNWAFLYQMPDTDDWGYQKYLVESQKIAAEMIALYKEQHPTEPMKYELYSNYESHYKSLYGSQPLEQFTQELDQTVQGDFRIETAVHGTQHTPILVNEQGEPVGIIKTKNEILAHRLDHEHFACVPPALKYNIPKTGEVIVQKWVPDAKMATEYAREKELNSEQLHHIRVLDIRMGNSDRNKGNVLVAEKEDRKFVIPIDHDLIHHYIPNDTNWEASYLNVPFSPLSKSYIQKLDIEKDAKIMDELGYSKEEIKSMKLRTTLLKMAVERHLSLRETDMMFRFYYYDLLEKSNHLTAESSENDIRKELNGHIEQICSTVQNPIEVWGLIGDNYEIYL